MKAAPRSTDLLRARLLAAMGLPALAALATATATTTACREAEHPTAATDLVVTTVDGGKVESTGKRTSDDAMDATEPRTCNRDEVLEHVCGLTAAARRGEVSIARCGEDATSIEIKEEASSLTRAGGFYNGDPGAEELKRDDGLTAQVRKRARSNANSLCCYSRCTAASVAAEGSPIPPGANTLLRCTPLFRAGTSAPAGTDPLCAAAIDFGEGHGVAPFESRQADTCCYRAVSPRPMIIRGRPLREAGLPVLAEARAQSGGWTDAIEIDTSNLDPQTRSELATAFTTDAALEHASVAAFSRLALELMALGAPAHLVDRAHVAARDEIRHARVAYALASSFAGEARGPGPLPIGVAARAPDLRTLALESFVEGCVGETVAALELGEASALACAPIARALEAMAADEASHAELAWLIVAWGLEVGGDEIARALAARVTELATELEAPGPPFTRGRDLSGYGVLDDASRQRIRNRAIAEVALPCARALLSRADGSLEIQNSFAAGHGTPTCQSIPIESADHPKS